MQLRQRRVDTSLLSYQAKDNVATFFWCFNRGGSGILCFVPSLLLSQFTLDLSLLIDRQTLNLSKSFPSSCAHFLLVHLTPFVVHILHVRISNVTNRQIKNIFPDRLCTSLKKPKQNQTDLAYSQLYLGHLLVGNEALIVKSYLALRVFSFSFNGGFCCCKPKG